MDNTPKTIGVHQNVPFADYLKWEAVNWSTLKSFRKSAKHGRHSMLAADDANQSQVKGGALDTLVFDGEAAFGATYACMPFFAGHPNSNAYKEAKAAWQADHAESVHLTQAELNEVQGMYASLMADERAKILLQGGKGKSQLSMVWNDGDTLCKGRLDTLRLIPAATLNDAAKVGDNVLTLVDLKSSRNPGPYWFEKDIVQYGYSSQLASYRNALTKFEPGDMAVVIVAVENVAPFDVVIHWLSEESLELGKKVYDKCLARYQRGMATGEWPGIAEGKINVVTLPPWAENSEG